MKDLKPTVFADLIAMNALYRPGPLGIFRRLFVEKWEEPITYDLDACEEYLGNVRNYRLPRAGNASIAKIG